MEIWEITNKSSQRQYTDEFAASILDAELDSGEVQAVYVYGAAGELVALTIDDGQEPAQ